MNYSIIVPVYNRPDEVSELLESLCSQTVKNFEVIIVEDGSEKTCKDVCDNYADILDLHYYYKDNSGPGQSRNYGAERAKGEWLIVLDSDVVLPPDYMAAVNSAIFPSPVTLHPSPSFAAFGGPDASHPSFTPIQKAISYSMTSFFTTGGIRGGKGKKLDKFFPRSYNMGIRREVYQELGGFTKMRFGEDIDFSYRIVEAGNLEKRHPGTLKLVHLLPTVFTLGVITLLLAALITILLPLSSFLIPLSTFLCISPIILYSGIIFIDSSLKNKSMWLGLLSIPAAFVQLMGYGFGFIESWWKRCVLKQDEFTAFEKNFYK